MGEAAREPTLAEVHAEQVEIDRANIGGRTMDWIRARCEVDANGCWLWQGAVTSRGYPSCSVPGKRGRSQTVHRLALTLKLGRRIQGMALHSCDVPRCCNPDHLRDGSAHDNSQDARERGRLATKERNGNARITSILANDIRLMISKGVSIAVVSRATGVARHVIADIAHGVTWQDEEKSA